MSHDHHGHAHHHHASPTNDGLDAAFRWGVGLNLGYTLLEAAAGLWFGSLALLADAAHNLTDVAAVALAMYAVRVARRRATVAKSFGYHRATTLAAQANAPAQSGCSSGGCSSASQSAPSRSKALPRSPQGKDKSAVLLLSLLRVAGLAAAAGVGLWALVQAL